jgi:hypothetical protein
MDIRKQQTKTKTKDTKSKQSEETKFEAGIIQTAGAKVMLPPAILGKLSALTAKYGIPFDLSNIGLDGKMAENVKSLRKIVEMVEGDSKLLPEMMKLIRRLFKAEIKLAQFHKLVTKASIKHQEKIDKECVDIFLMMANAGAKSVKREHRTNVRNQLIEKRSEAYSNYYQDTVYGAESKLIDAEYAVLESNKKILSASKTVRAEFSNQRKQKIEGYVQSAFND